MVNEMFYLHTHKDNGKYGKDFSLLWCNCSSFSAGRGMDCQRHRLSAGDCNVLHTGVSVEIKQVIK